MRGEWTQEKSNAECLAKYTQTSDLIVALVCTMTRGGSLYSEAQVHAFKDELDKRLPTRETW